MRVDEMSAVQRAAFEFAAEANAAGMSGLVMGPEKIESRLREIDELVMEAEADALSGEAFVGDAFAKAGMGPETEMRPASLSPHPPAGRDYGGASFAASAPADYGTRRCAVLLGACGFWASAYAGWNAEWGVALIALLYVGFCAWAAARA